MDTLDNPLTTRLIQTGCEMSIKQYLNWWFGCIDDPDHQFGNWSVPTHTQTRSAGLEPLLTLRMSNFHSLVEIWKGSQNLGAIQMESPTQNREITALAQISNTEVIVKTSWSNFQPHCVQHLNCWKDHLCYQICVQRTTLEDEQKHWISAKWSKLTTNQPEVMGIVW
jgi:hypothetical protein